MFCIVISAESENKWSGSSIIMSLVEQVRGGCEAVRTAVHMETGGIFSVEASHNVLMKIYLLVHAVTTHGSELEHEPTGRVLVVSMHISMIHFCFVEDLANVISSMMMSHHLLIGARLWKYSTLNRTAQLIMALDICGGFWYILIGFFSVLNVVIL